ncbi:MAG TPA: cupin domain-containing protein [Terriglobales bacterium]|jgi:hypothetical protein|nr:cupin domain-containing protein [Terriglobales bacterium]
MSKSGIYFSLRQSWLLAGLTIVALLTIGSLKAAELDSKALVYKLPSQLNWVESKNGQSQAILWGDPSKPGPYGVLAKWSPHHNSHPHFHPHDRFIHVISGTWWVATGSNYNLDSMVPVPAGSFVTHFANGIHYDGAKDEEVMLEIVGDGPATSTQVGDK